jgi:hypothetical protein
MGGRCGSSLSLPLPRSSFGGVGGPECRFVYCASLGGVGGRPTLGAVPESFGGVGGGRPCEWSLEPGSRFLSSSFKGGAGRRFVSVLRPLLPPVLADSTASSTTGSVVPSSPRSADGLRTKRISRWGTSSSDAPLRLERSACPSAL